jgi:hypothetical protein
MLPYFAMVSDTILLLHEEVTMPQLCGLELNELV